MTQPNQTSRASADSSLVVGIDLGTTNSSLAFVRDGLPVLIELDGSALMPSVVGATEDGSLKVGRAARNQLHLYPERTVASVKRHMGTATSFALGGHNYSPVEISALILRRLRLAAEAELGRPVGRAVITVPAYFSDAQRTATREAGEVAGFVVERILNEPTAASLAYAGGSLGDGTFAVYDLGGGTFDVSIVRVTGDTTIVLASHGDTRLGGDDFDALLAAHLRQKFEDTTGADLRHEPRAEARLKRAAEEAKIALSTVSYVRVTEEHLVEVGGKSCHLDVEVSRPEYEALIQPLLERTLDSVQTALHEAKLGPADITEVILVGGASRTPRVSELLQGLLGKAPRMDVDPDKAVAIGASLQAARIAGVTTQRILVDVSPFSFGTSYLGVIDGYETPDCYSVILRRNTPLPSRASKVFYTATPNQEVIHVHVFQGEERFASDNLLLGDFTVEGLDPDADEGSPVIFDLALDLDGILQVSVTEKETGLSKAVTIADAFRTLSAAELEASRKRVKEALFDELSEFDSEDWEDDDEASPDKGSESGTLTSAFPSPPDGLSDEEIATWERARKATDKANALLAGLEGVDRSEVLDILRALESALTARDLKEVAARTFELSDVLFYLE